MASTTRVRAPHPGEILYPESDGRPLGETDEHRRAAEAEVRRWHEEIARLREKHQPGAA